MKKILITVLIVLLSAGAIIGAGFGINACVQEKKKSGGIYKTISYIEEEYSADDTMVFKVVAQSDKAITAVKYTIDNGTETAVTSKTGETKNNDGLKERNGAYYLDSGIEIVDISELTAGTHVATFYLYQDTVRTEIGVFIFRILPSAS